MANMEVTSIPSVADKFIPSYMASLNKPRLSLQKKYSVLSKHSIIYWGKSLSYIMV